MTDIAAPQDNAPTSLWSRITAIRRHPLSLKFGLGITLVLLFTAAVSLVWTPYEPTKMDILNRLTGPSWQHLLGTDQFGRDVLSLIMVGSQNALVIGLVAVTIGLVIGTAVGLFAAACGGFIEEALMRISDFVFAFPVVLSAVMLAAVFGPGSINSILAIGVYNIPVFARITRGAAKTVLTREYIMAARMAGKNRFTISLIHVLPNVTNIIVVQATISFAIAILADAALSYLGLGTPPPSPSWGRMLQEAQSYMSQAVYLAIFPGLAISLTVLGLNLLGDGLRDLIDPRFAEER